MLDDVRNETPTIALQAQRTSFRNVSVSRMIPMTTATNTAPKRKTPKTSAFRYWAGSWK
jgi:hypothetical protein